MQPKCGHPAKFTDKIRNASLILFRASKTTLPTKKKKNQTPDPVCSCNEETTARCYCALQRKPSLSDRALEASHIWFTGNLGQCASKDVMGFWCM